MIFTISKSTLMHQLGLINPILPVHSTKPITECIILDLKDNILKITATDLSITLVSNLEVNGVEDGISVIHGKRFYSIIKSLPESNITIKKENKIVKIISGTIKFEVSLTEDYNDFPATPDELSNNKFIIDSLKLKKYISKTSFAVSTDELRAVLTGVLFSLKFNELTMVATDSLRLVKLEDKNIAYEGEDTDIILPAKSLQIVSNAITKNEDCTIFFENNYIEFKFENTTIFSRLINGKYPSYQAIIPVNNSLKVKLNKSIITQAISRIAIACNPLTRRIKSTFVNDKLILTAEDATTSSKAEEILNIEYDAEEIIIGFNATKILDLLKNTETDFVEFDIGSAIKPVIIKPYESTDSYNMLMLVMPIKVSE